jgi:hypothetical protein
LWRWLAISCLPCRSANKILTKFRGREGELFAKVAAKYNQPTTALLPAT